MTQSHVLTFDHKYMILNSMCVVYLNGGDKIMEFQQELTVMLF